LATLAAIRRLVATASLLLALLGLACGSTTTTGPARVANGGPRPVGDAAKRPPRAQAITLSYRPLFSLPAAVQDPATATLSGGRFVLLGGITAAVTSTAAITVADAHGQVGSANLPGAQHDAQAAVLRGSVYVFGGGEFTQYDHILRFDPAASAVSQVAALPTAESDVAVTQLDGTAYVVGGFDGSNALDTIVAWSPASQARTVARLPVSLRYAAAAAVPGYVLIMGGSAPTGASEAIYRFQPSTGAVQQIGKLPQPVTHAGAATLGSTVYLIGGRGDSTTSQTSAIWAIDPANGAVRPAGRLPQPLSDAGVLAVQGTIVVAGGHSPAGTQAAVGELVPAA
jgi:hypothetical protein